VASFDEVIPPGQVGRVTAKVDTKELRGPVDRGITLFTDDPDQPNVPLWIHVEAAGSVLLLPRAHLDLRVGQAKAPPAARLLVRQDPGERGELKLTGAKVDAPWLRVGARKVAAAEPAAELPEAQPGDVVLTVEVTGEVPEGSHKQTLRFETGLPIEPTVEVPVLVYVRPRLQVSPEPIFFGPAGPDGMRRATVLVALREDVSSEPLTVEGPEGLQSTLDPAGAHRFNVRLSWSAKAAPTGAVVFRAGTASRSVPIAPGP
jgi:hypothetical protein